MRLGILEGKLAFSHFFAPIDQRMKGRIDAMDRTTNKARLLDELRNEQAQWEALLSEIHNLGEQRMTQPGVTGEWSIKDIVAHLSFWQRRAAVERLRAALRHEPTPPPPWPLEFGAEDDVPDDDANGWDQINAWIYATNRDRPLTDVLRESREVFDEMVEALDAFSEAELLDPTRFPFMKGKPLPMTGAEYFDHFHDEHEPEMRAWLERIKREER